MLDLVGYVFGITFIIFLICALALGLKWWWITFKNIGKPKVNRYG